MQTQTQQKETASFLTFDNDKAGLLFDDSKHEKFPIRYYNWIDDEGFTPKVDCSYFIYAYKQRPTIIRKYRGQQYVHGLAEGQFASITGDFVLAGIGKAIVIEVLHAESEYYKANKYRATFQIGELEEEGRLKYIDGCTDSLLIPPIKMGDPCFNHLHFPEGINQTQHTHPSNRIGIVTNGSGVCHTPFGDLPLAKDMIFIIREWDGKSYSKGRNGDMFPNGQHSFETFNHPMDVVAFHPDSDFGATDIDHPMINRTIVDGKSASELDDIRTK